MHHAYLLVGSPNAAEAYLKDMFGDLLGSPDYFLMKEASFGINDARKLSAMAVRKAFTERKIFLIVPEVITPEAQNALLKTFEEPIADTHFFLVVRDEGVVIPTLRSRMALVRLEGENEISGEAKKFLNSALKERLNFVKKFVDKEENLSAFLDNLLLLAKNSEMKKNIFTMRLLSDQRAASSRLILEHLSLVL